MLLPSVLVVIALLVQPVCMFWTRTVMRGAAAETARLAATAAGPDALDACERFARARLRAVPEASLFHVGGASDWQVSVAGAGTDVVEVAITGHARPLPLMSAIASAFGACDAEGVVLTESVRVRARPDWLEGGYGDWIGMW